MGSPAVKITIPPAPPSGPRLVEPVADAWLADRVGAMRALSTRYCVVADQARRLGLGKLADALCDEADTIHDQAEDLRRDVAVAHPATFGACDPEAACDDCAAAYAQPEEEQI